MRRGASAYRPSSIYLQVSAEIIMQANSIAEAQAQFAQYQNNDLPKSYGSPDPLAGGAWKAVDSPAGFSANDQIIWRANQRQLLVQRGTTIASLSVRVHEKPEEDLALALTLAPLLQLDVAHGQNVIRSYAPH